MSYNIGQFPQTRLRRLRQNPSARAITRETYLRAEDFILPLFIRYGTNIKNPIASMPGHFQLSVDQLEPEIHSIVTLGIKGILLFGIPETKDPLAKDSYCDASVIQSAIKTIKKIAPDLLIITDVCLCEYTDHGHCGVTTKNGNEYTIENDHTLTLLAQQAVAHAQAGADMVAPSGMMDGMVHAIRKALDEVGYTHTPILSYSAKYCSGLYAPFREAAEGIPQFGDRRTHQLDYANTSETLRECGLDITEGADMLMVKPAHAYLDIIVRVKQTYPSLPLCAYHTSGEYAMIKAASEKGWINERQIVFEVLTAIRRAGADCIITYYAKDIVRWLSESAN